MVIYTISLFIALSQRSETRKSKNTVIQDLSDSPPVYTVNKDNFGIAHIFRNSLSVPIYDESYLNVRYYQVTRTVNNEGVIVYDKTEYGHDYCNQDFPFSDIDYFHRTGILPHVR